MRRRALHIIVIALITVCSVAAAAERDTGLAGRLPADRTMFYAHVDLDSLLSAGERSVQFIDEEAGGKIVYQTENLYGLLRELAANYRFEPALLDHIREADLSIVSMLKDEPEVTSRTVEFPSFDPETGEPIEGEMEEHTFTRTSYFTTSLVVRAPDADMAADFLEQFRGFFDFIKESDPEMQDVQRREIEVEQGELIGFSDGAQTVGRLDEYIVLSDANPEQLWGALMATPAATLDQAPVYGRMVAVENSPHAFGMLNLQVLVKRWQDTVERNLENAREQSGAEAQSEGQPNRQQIELMMAQQAYSTFQLMHELMSLDKLRFISGSLWSRTGGERSRSVVTAQLGHDSPISPVLRELLEGSGSYQLPPITTGDEVTLMGRVNLELIYDEVIKALQETAGEQGMSQFNMMMQMMRMQIGADVGDILGLLASDLYLSVDVVEKEITRREFQGFDEETEEPRFESVTSEETLPEVTTLWGVRDPAVARQTLDTIFTRISNNPQMSSVVKKRTYQETDVYCFGADAAREENYPDGVTSFAVVVVERYLTLGGWEKVTDLIRRTRAAGASADESLREIVENNREANMIAVVPRAFREKMQEKVQAAQEEAGMDAFDMMLQRLRVAEFNLEDPEMEQEIKASLEELLKAMRALNEKSQHLMPERSVVTGKHQDNFYEVRTENEIVK